MEFYSFYQEKDVVAAEHDESMEANGKRNEIDKLNGIIEKRQEFLWRK